MAPSMPRISLDDYYKTKDTLDAAIADAHAQRAKQGGKEHEQETKSEPKETSDLWTWEANMPVHPAEENTGENITDMVAKMASDSTASDHPLHEESNDATSGGSTSRATAEHHKAAPGPVIPEDMPKAESKENLKARAAELNQDG